MSIYNRAVTDAPKVDRRIVRAVNLVSVAIPVPGGVFGLEDVWRALQALAKKEQVPLECGRGDVSKALDALVNAGILTCRAGAYAVRPPGEAAPTRAAPKKPDAPPPAAGPTAAPVVEVLEEAAEPVAAVVEAPVVEAEPPKARRQRTVLKAAAEAGTLPLRNQEVLDLLTSRPMTTAEVRAALGESATATRCRLHRLLEAGLLKVTGRVAAHDRPAMNVWALVDPRDQSAGPGEPDGGAEVETTPPPTPAQDPPLVEEEALPKGGGWWRPLMVQLERFSASSVDAVTDAQALAARIQGALRYIAELEGEGAALATLCDGVHRELDAAGAPHHGTPAERVRWLVGKTSAEPDTTGPAWPSLHNLDLDAAEEALGAIERRCAAWRELLRAAREVAT